MAPRPTGSVLAKLLLLLLLLAGAAAAYAWGALKYAYSEGERVGYVQKFSRKGWLCKTWEGELAMVTLPGAVPEKFLFTVRSEEIAQQINRSLGKRVDLHYDQHPGLPTQCFGETDYFITAVRPLE